MLLLLLWPWCCDTAQLAPCQRPMHDNLPDSCRAERTGRCQKQTLPSCSYDIIGTGVLVSSLKGLGWKFSLSEIWLSAIRKKEGKSTKFIQTFRQIKFLGRPLVVENSVLFFNCPTLYKFYEMFFICPGSQSIRSVTSLFTACCTKKMLQLSFAAKSVVQKGPNNKAMLVILLR